MIVYDVLRNAGGSGYLGTGGEEPVVIGRFAFNDDETVASRTGVFDDPTTT